MNLNKYETLYIVSAKIEETQRKALIEKLTNLCPEGTEVDEWGIKDLAYPIRAKSTGEHFKGFYILVKYTSTPEFPEELQRHMRLSDDVLRFLTERVS